MGEVVNIYYHIFYRNYLPLKTLEKTSSFQSRKMTMNRGTFIRILYQGTSLSERMLVSDS